MSIELDYFENCLFSVGKKEQWTNIDWVFCTIHVFFTAKVLMVFVPIFMLLRSMCEVLGHEMSWSEDQGHIFLDQNNILTFRSPGLRVLFDLFFPQTYNLHIALIYL